MAVQYHMLVAWKSVLMDCGVLYVMICLTKLMRMWFVKNWAIVEHWPHPLTMDQDRDLYGLIM